GRPAGTRVSESPARDLELRGRAWPRSLQPGARRHTTGAGDAGHVVTDWGLVFLGVIALATLAMALIQVGVIVVTARLAKQAQQAVAKAHETLTTAQQTISSVREGFGPLIATATAIAEEASRAATLATAQVQKVDRLVTDLTAPVG